MLYMSSLSTNDGNMQLTVTFALGTNLDIANVLVQNRLSVAQPRLPGDVRNLGVTVRKSSPDLMMVVHVLSPDGTFDQNYLANYIYLRLRDPLLRLNGVGDITLALGTVDILNSNLRWLQHGDVTSVEQNLTRAGHQKFGQQIEASRLASTIGADQRMDMSAPDLQIDFTDGGESFEFTRQLTGFQDDVGHLVSLLRTTNDSTAQRSHIPSAYPQQSLSAECSASRVTR